MITVKDLTKKYGSFQALKGLSFEIQQGEIVGLLGPNGAGKTTTLKILSGFLEPTGGYVMIDGMDITEKPIKIKQKLGYLPETNPLYDDMKVREYLSYVSEIKGVEAGRRADVIDETIKKTGLTEKAGQLISKLSKGYKQRVGLAQALINDPQILILDEPTEGLDPNQRIEIRNLIRELGKERTVIFSSHILSEIEAVCDRVLIMHQGVLVASGTPAELKSETKSVNRINLVVEAELEAIRSRLIAIGSIIRLISCEADGNLCRLALESDAGEDVRPHLIRVLTENSIPVYELTQETKSLEDVFVTLTKLEK